MSKIKRYTSDEIDKLKSQSDKKKFDATSEKDILEQAMSDPDTPILTDKELREMKLAKEKNNGKKEDDQS